MKKYLLVFLVGIFAALQLSAQIVDPVKWSFDSKALENGNYELMMTAKIDKGWYIYSQDIEDGGPVPTSFTFEKNKTFKVIGDVKEKGELIEKNDKMFGMMIKKYPNEVTFIATVKPTKAKANVTGYLEFMTCDDSRCLPPEEVEFEFALDKIEKKKVSSPDAKSKKSTNSNSGIAPKQDLTGSTGPGSPNKAKQRTILDPVKWSFRQESLGKDEYLLHFDAKIDQGWYVYSQNVKDGGPVPTSFTFEESKTFKTKGKVDESGDMIEKNDKMFSMMVRKYADKIHFQQKVKALKPNAKVTGYLEFMTCDDSRCLPPEEVEFSFNLGEKDSGTGAVPTNNAGGSTANNASGNNGGNTNGNNASGNNGANAGQTANNTVNGTAATASNTTQGKTETSDKAAASSGMFKNLITDCGAPVYAAELQTVDGNTTGGGTKKGRTPWVIFLLGFLGGFAALLTPCVFPMIPLTVSFFTKSSTNRAKGISNAIIYGLSIIVIYVALGFFVTKAFGADTLSILSTNVWFNLAFFAIFVVFAFSFFGYFEITLPNALINKSDEASEKGGLIGIFFMAFTLALVSFSCTGPIIGTLLVEAAVQGKTLGPVVGMTGFAVALALPFALFAAFPAWLNSLPKSGGWLTSVKVVLGFIELIFALKFLSNADMVKKWGILPREVFLGIWVILLIGLALYLFGKIRFPHDSKLKKISPVRGGLGALAVAAALYLTAGIFGNPVSLVSGFPPPTFYSLFNAEDEHLHDIEKGLAEAKRTGKPLLVDFTGWACVNCRKMEENVWPDVHKLMEEYTIVSLYVDEDIALPKDEQFRYELEGKKKRVRTVGNKWSYLEATCFNTNSQPYYVLLNHDGEHLANPRGYTPDITTYSSFLEQGIENFKNGKKLLSGN